MQADANAGTAKAQQDVSTLLRERHRLAEDAPNDFDVRDLSELANSRQQSTAKMGIDAMPHRSETSRSAYSGLCVASQSPRSASKNSGGAAWA